MTFHPVWDAAVVLGAVDAVDAVTSAVLGAATGVGLVVAVTTAPLEGTVVVAVASFRASEFAGGDAPLLTITATAAMPAPSKSTGATHTHR